MTPPFANTAWGKDAGQAKQGGEKTLRKETRREKDAEIESCIQNDFYVDDLVIDVSGLFMTL